jgi:S-adenosylmethionine:tRNA ribosyltransferase-isomerase
MKTSDFYFELPEELIAQEPSPHRGESRLLVYSRKSGEIIHTKVSELASYIPEDALMVFNNTRVRKARVYGVSDTGSRVEFLFLQPLDAEGVGFGPVQLFPSLEGAGEKGKKAKTRAKL